MSVRKTTHQSQSQWRDESIMSSSRAWRIQCFIVLDFSLVPHYTVIPSRRHFQIMKWCLSVLQCIITHQRHSAYLSPSRQLNSGYIREKGIQSLQQVRFITLLSSFLLSVQSCAKYCASTLHSCSMPFVWRLHQLASP
jgi:hypothetical protein